MSKKIVLFLASVLFVLSAIAQVAHADEAEGKKVEDTIVVGTFDEILFGTSEVQDAEHVEIKFSCVEYTNVRVEEVGRLMLELKDRVDTLEAKVKDLEDYIKTMEMEAKK